MQYFEQFNVYWEAIMLDFLQMGVDGREHRPDDSSSSPRPTKSSLASLECPAQFFSVGYHKNVYLLYKQLYRCYVIWGFQRKIVIVPALLMLSTFIVGIAAAVTGPSFIISDLRDLQIAASLAAATNTVITALTGKLESGAIYCIMAILLDIAVSLYKDEIYYIGVSIGEQMINIIPTFTLVYVGLNNTDYTQPKEHIRQVASTHHASSRSAVVRPCEPREVLDIKPQSTEEKDREGV
ncbi:hypothetical protein B0H13DRAFT_1856621 [Mycena leptocephala]|nr:hypothetical protein B0H13DRAFT_1856621 [Mycena leptocephala]